MIASQTMLQHYRLTEHEIAALKKLLPLVEPVTPRLTENFYEYLRTLPETAAFLQDEAQAGKTADSTTSAGSWGFLQVLLMNTILSGCSASATPMSRWACRLILFTWP